MCSASEFIPVSNHAGRWYWCFMTLCSCMTLWKGSSAELSWLYAHAHSGTILPRTHAHCLMFYKRSDPPTSQIHVQANHVYVLTRWLEQLRISMVFSCMDCLRWFSQILLAVINVLVVVSAVFLLVAVCLYNNYYVYSSHGSPSLNAPLCWMQTMPPRRCNHVMTLQQACMPGIKFPHSPTPTKEVACNLIHVLQPSTYFSKY